jgi:hypothetical protein
MVVGSGPHHGSVQSNKGPGTSRETIWHLSAEEARTHCHWLKMINNRLDIDCAMTNVFKYEKKALKVSLVKATWTKTLKGERTLAKDWPKRVGGFGGSADRRLTFVATCLDTRTRKELKPHISCYRGTNAVDASPREVSYRHLAWFQVQGLILKRAEFDRLCRPGSSDL